MGRIRSLRTQTRVDVAQRTRSCKGNARHRIQRGEQRLKVRHRQGWSHYCIDCARKIVRRDIAALEKLEGEL